MLWFGRAAIGEHADVRRLTRVALPRQTPHMPSLMDIVRYTDDYLRLDVCVDWPNALNGLEVENSGRVEKIGAAVDASTRVISEAVDHGVHLLVVHHGLFWPGLQPVTGGLYRQLKLALENDVAVYSAHLPLDIHPVVGNNAQFAALLGLRKTEPFLEVKGQCIGLRSQASVQRAELAIKAEQSLGGAVKSFFFGPEETRTIGLVTGGAGGEIYAIAREGVDTFITGEAPHWAAIAAEELKLNLLLGGHYATETFGVKALGAHLSEKFSVPWEFIDAPTGL